MDQMGEFEQKIKNDTAIQQQEVQVRTICKREVLEEKRILGFIRAGKAACRKQVGEDRREAMRAHIVATDPYADLDGNEVEALVKVMAMEEEYSYEKDHVGFGEVPPELFAKIVDERHLRVRMNKILEESNKRLGHLRDFIGHLEGEKKAIQDGFEACQVKCRKTAERDEKLKFNFEVVVYLKQGQVEVPQLPVATDYKDAILVSKAVLLQENREIGDRGKQKVDNMGKILLANTTLKQVESANKRLRLQIRDFIERAKDVQLYRVTKATQEIIQGKHQKRDEEDKKRLESQIKQLESNAAKRVQTFNVTKAKLKREIREKDLENKQLDDKARQLQQNVDQRK